MGARLAETGRCFPLRYFAEAWNYLAVGVFEEVRGQGFEDVSLILTCQDSCHFNAIISFTFTSTLQF